ncbi:MAG: hypothetical protein HC884_00100 [Chloroflexaceae bacterium]|nr:hypothetical protein [Chloroflexaceae bacterium]
MLLMMTFIAKNWTEYGAIAKEQTIGATAPSSSVLGDPIGVGHRDPPAESMGELAWPSRPNDLPRVGYLAGADTIARLMASGIICLVAPPATDARASRGR